MTPAEVRRLEAERDAYREAFRDVMIAYLKAGHGMTGAQAVAVARRVMDETERRIAEEHSDDPASLR